MEQLAKTTISLAGTMKDDLVALGERLSLGTPGKRLAPTIRFCCSSVLESKRAGSAPALPRIAMLTEGRLPLIERIIEHYGHGFCGEDLERDFGFEQGRAGEFLTRFEDLGRLRCEDGTYFPVAPPLGKPTAGEPSPLMVACGRPGPHEPARAMGWPIGLCEAIWERFHDNPLESYEMRYAWAIRAGQGWMSTNPYPGVFKSDDALLAELKMLEDGGSFKINSRTKDLERSDPPPPGRMAKGAGSGRAGDG